MSRLLAVPPKTVARDVVLSVNPRAGARSRLAQVRAIEQGIGAAGYRVRTVTELALAKASIHYDIW